MVRFIRWGGGDLPPFESTWQDGPGLLRHSRPLWQKLSMVKKQVFKYKTLGCSYMQTSSELILSSP